MTHTRGNTYTITQHTYAESSSRTHAPFRSQQQAQSLDCTRTDVVRCHTTLPEPEHPPLTQHNAVMCAAFATRSRGVLNIRKRN